MVKVERSLPAPASLETEAAKENGSYKEADVVERLKKDFHDKCYICELKGLSDPQVEHLLPHKNGKYRERMFDWNNLFWACPHCNNVKNQKKYDEGIIDCCKYDPEELLLFSLKEDNIHIEAADLENKEAERTADLIYEVFNLKNTGIRVAACDYRMKLLMETMDIFYREFEKYKRNINSNRNKRSMKSQLRRESAFAAFKRGYIRSRIAEFPELAEYIR